MSLVTRTILSRFGYSILKNELTVKEMSEIKKQAEVIPYVPPNSPYGSKPDPIQCWFESAERLYVPRYIGQKMYGKAVDNKLNVLTPIDITFSGKLRDFQVPVVDKCIRKIKEDGGGVLSVYCGYGKTCCALYILCVLKLKTLIIVHNSDLFEQWTERIQHFIPGATIGHIQGDIADVYGKDIVIGMVQSISKKDYEADTFKHFSFLIVDEVHLICTNSFSKAFRKIGCPHALGLSATPYRKDKCEKIFEHYIGPIIHYEQRPPNNDMIVKMIRYKLPIDFTDIRLANGDISYVSTLVKIVNIDHRMEHIVSTVIELVKTKRKVLVLSEYVEHLKMMFEKLLNHEYKDFTAGLYLGEMNKNQRKESQGCDIILGTYKLASVGMDIADLNTLIMASPRKEIEQSVGRILRGEGGQIKPVVIDYVDNHPTFYNQSNARKIFYKKCGYNIESVPLNQDGSVKVKKTAVKTPKGKAKVVEEKEEEDDEEEETVNPIKKYMIRQENTE